MMNMATVYDTERIWWYWIYLRVQSLLACFIVHLICKQVCICQSMSMHVCMLVSSFNSYCSENVMYCYSDHMFTKLSYLVRSWKIFKGDKYVKITVSDTIVVLLAKELFLIPLLNKVILLCFECGLEIPKTCLAKPFFTGFSNCGEVWTCVWIWCAYTMYLHRLHVCARVRKWWSENCEIENRMSGK